MKTQSSKFCNNKWLIILDKVRQVAIVCLAVCLYPTMQKFTKVIGTKNLWIRMISMSYLHLRILIFFKLLITLL
jgi:hypothetical protein